MRRNRKTVIYGDYVTWGKKMLMFFVGLYLFFSTVILSYAKEEPGSLYAQSAVLMDGSSGRILYEKNGQEFLANASTTKIMTCILALEKADLMDEVVVSSYAATMPDVQLHIKEGERFRLEDLLYSLMLESHNDVAVAIAEHVAGSIEQFSEMMNQKAKEIGCKNTLFLTPNGLDATLKGKEMAEKYHGTTSEDLALIMRYCIEISPKREVFIKITSSTSHTFCDLEQKRNFTCYNHNSLFHLMEGVISGKTGFTNKAGYCYVGAVKQEGKTFIVALLACGWPGNKNYKWKDCKTLLEYGEKEYRLVDLEALEQEYMRKQNVLVKEAKSKDLKKEVRISVEGKKQDAKTILLKPEEKLVLKFEDITLTAPVSKGQKVGLCKYYINDELWKVKEVFSKENVEKVDYKWCLEKMIEKSLL